MSRGAKIFLFSAAGTTADGVLLNVGDEALSDCLARALVAEGAAGVTRSISGPPPDGGGEFVATRPVGGLLKAIKRSDRVVIGGGTMLQPQRKLMRAVLVVALAARILRKPLTITAVGVESSSNRSYRRALRLLSRLATATSVRDARSGATLEQSGFKSVLVAADPVLLEDSAPVAESGADAAISLRRDASDALIDALASALASTLQQGATVMLVPMDNRPDRDRSALERLRRRLEPGMRTIWSDENADWRSTAGQIGGAKLCVGMRLHFLYFAAIAGCKVVPIVSSDKTSAFTDEMNLSSASAADPASVAMAVEDARTPRDSSLEAARIRARSAVRQAIGG